LEERPCGAHIRERFGPDIETGCEFGSVGTVENPNPSGPIEGTCGSRVPIGFFIRIQIESTQTRSKGIGPIIDVEFINYGIIIVIIPGKAGVGLASVYSFT